jgi:hypothetical protein
MRNSTSATLNHACSAKKLTLPLLWDAPTLPGARQIHGWVQKEQLFGMIAGYERRILL